MTTRPWHLVAALLVAAVGIVALQAVVAARERTAPRPVALVRPEPSAVAGLGFRLVPVADAVLLAGRLASLPPDTAPVLELFADGALAVRRPPPRAEAPGSRGGVLAVVVPPVSLGSWSPAARGALAEVLAAAIAERPVPAARLRCVDGGVAMAELERLLAWLP